MNYRKTEEGWELNGKLLGPEIGVFYSITRLDGKPACTLHKHGSMETVKENFERTKELYKANGLHDMAEELRFVDASNASEEDLNKVLDTSLLPPKFFEALNPAEVERKITATRKILQSGPSDLVI